MLALETRSLAPEHSGWTLPSLKLHQAPVIALGCQGTDQEGLRGAEAQRGVWGGEVHTLQQ